MFIEKLKKPFVARLIAVVLVVVSTLVAVKVKLGQAVTDIEAGFFDGVIVDGIEHIPVSDPLRSICDVTDSILRIASNYGINTEEMSRQLDSIELSLAYSSLYGIGDDYKELEDETDALLLRLESIGLSERHQAAMTTYLQSLTASRNELDEAAAAYDKTVREFRRSYERFPTSWWADKFWISYPESFT